MKNKYLNRTYVLLSILLIFFAIFSLKVNASTINNINVEFDKDFYSVIEDSSIKIGYTLFNNNSEAVDLIVYTECDEEDLSCEYSKSFNISANSSITNSFYVKSLDDTTSNLKLYVKDIESNEDNYFSLEIESGSDLDEGEFEVDISKTSFCIGKSTSGQITIDNKYNSGLYDVSLISNDFITSLKNSNPIYLDNEKNIDFTVETPNTLIQGESYNLTLVIENEKVLVNKKFKVYAVECPIVKQEFTVNGINITNYTLNKEEPFTLKYTIKNISNNKKEFFISSSSDPLKTSLSNRQLTLYPQESKDIEVSVYANKRVYSGDYDVNLDFFDELTTISKRLNFILQPESNISARMLQGNNVALNIGHTLELDMILENQGDIADIINVTYSSTNDIQINTPNTSVNVTGYHNNMIPIIISAGENTKEQVSIITITLDGRNTDFHKQFTVYVNSIRSMPTIKLSYLSFPEQINVDVNSTKNFQIEVYNVDTEDITLSRITIAGLPQEITYGLPINVLIPSNTSKIISGTLIVGDIEPQEIKANIVFTSLTGGVLTKPVKIVIPGEEKLTDNKKKNIPITGFFTLKNSILSGIILLCLIVMLLFVSRVFKSSTNSFQKV